MMLTAYLHREIILITTNTNLTAESNEDPLEIFTDVADANFYLQEKDDEEVEKLVAYHGVLTRAYTIPEWIGNDPPFLVIEDIGAPGTGVIVETNATTPEEVSKEVKKIFKDKDLASFGFTINDIFVLYGYEVTIAYSVNTIIASRRGGMNVVNDNGGVYAIDEFDIDDNRFRALKRVADKAGELYTKYFTREVSIG
jgi:hypothetical protein